MKKIKAFGYKLYSKAYAYAKKHWHALAIGYGIGAGWIGFLWALFR